MSGAITKILTLFVSWFVLIFSILPEAALGQTDWKKEWEKTLAAAKAEGQLTVYASTYERVLESFKTEHPEIKLTSIGGRSSDVATRVIAERRAGKFWLT